MRQVTDEGRASAQRRAMRLTLGALVVLVVLGGFASYRNVGQVRTANALYECRAALPTLFSANEPRALFDALDDGTEVPTDRQVTEYGQAVDSCHDNAVDADKARAELKDGVLRLSLPKAESRKPRKIAIA